MPSDKRDTANIRRPFPGSLLGKALHTTAVAGKRALAALALLFAALVAVNSADESLTPQAAKALELPKVAVPPAENLYFALAGLPAPMGEDFHAWGQRRIEALGRAASFAEVAAARKKLPGPQLKFVGDHKRLCSFGADAPRCLESVPENIGAIAKLIEDNRELLARYERMQAYARFDDAFPGRVLGTLPPGTPAVSVHRLWLSAFVLKLDGRPLAESLEELARDIAFQRRQLAGARYLVTKMIAAGALQRDWRLLAEMLAARKDAAASLGRIFERLLAPFDASELALYPVVENEFRAATIQRNAIDWAEWSNSAFDAAVTKAASFLFFKPQTTTNLAHRLATAHMALDQARGMQFAQAEQAVSETIADAATPTPAWLYNPFGKFLVGVSAASYGNYARRLRDVEGLRRLVVLQWRMISAGVGDAAVPSFLEKAGADLGDPFDERPMRWDAQRRQIYFVTRASPLTGKDGRISTSLSAR